MSDPASITLSPCPFCGGQPVLDDLGDHDSHYVHCLDCEVQQIANYLPHVAAARWNKRPPALAQPVRAQAGVAELVNAYRAIEASTLSHDMRVGRLLHAIKQYVGAAALAALNGGEDG